MASDNPSTQYRYMSGETCKICGGKIKARMLCKRHYEQAQSRGFADAPQRTPEQVFHSRYKIRPDGCWEWLRGRHKFGHGQFCLPGRDAISAHRFSYQIHKGFIPAGMNVLHSCDNPWCVNPDHLRIGTQRDNINDKVKRSRQARGERQGLAVLSEEKVKAIRLAYPSKGITELAREYGCAKYTIHAVVHRKTWRHVQ